VKPSHLGLLLLLVGNFFLASNFVVGDFASSLMPPWQLAFARFSIAALVLIPFSWHLFRAHARQLYELRWPLFFQAFFGVTLSAGFAFEALDSITAITGGFIFAMAPMVTMIMAHFFLRDHLSPIQVCGILVSIVGVMGIVSQGNPANLLKLAFPVGVWWMVANVFSYAIFMILVKKYYTNLPSLLVINTILMIGAILLVVPATLEYLFGYHAANTLKLDLTILYAGVVTGALAYGLIIRGTHLSGARLSGLFIYSLPVFSTLQAAAVLGRKLYGYDYISIAIICIGMVLCLLPMLGKQQEQAHEAA
jgi:drug/metabolite transporter (DMT)-like permease